jgi:hypothetical protein
MLTGGGGDGVTVTNYGGLAVWKGAWGPSILHMFFSFSVVSLNVICTN